MFRIGLGQAEGIDTEMVVNRVIEACTTQIQGVSPQAGIVLAGPNFNHQLMLDLISGAFPGMDVIGCTTAGDFSSAFGFSDDAVTLMVLSSDDIEIATGVGKGLSQNSETAVRDAIQSATGKIHGAPALCLTFPQGYDIRYEPILKKLNAELGSDCPIFGGAAGTQWSKDFDIFQFHNQEVLDDAIPILLLSGPVKYAFSITNSWRPLGKKAMVGEASGRIVYQIGDLSAVDFYRHYLGHHEEPAREFILAVYEKGREEFYMRAPVEYHEDGSVTFSETIPVGAEVQLTEAVRDDMIQDTITTVKHLNNKVQGWEPAFALAFSCAFRKEILGTAAGKELEILKAHFPPHLPISGFYSFGEIAPLVRGGESLAHGATLITLLVGPKSDHPLLVTGDREELTEMSRPEDLEYQNTFLQRKLLQSEGYRERLESIKGFNSQMHRRIMAEIDEARLKLEQKEAALRKSEEKYRRIVQTTGEGFVLMDENLTIIDANDAYCKLVGYQRADILGKSNVDLATNEFRQFLESNRGALLAGEYRKFEGSLVAKNGSHVPVLIHGNTLRDDRGEVIGHMAFISDMTEQKKALELAGEVQRSLLPQENPRVPGLDVAGRNISCDEVGGDYYDFFWRRQLSKSPFSVAVGDITGHGVDAALLMTSARAFLRLHASREETISEILSATNQHLAQDVLDTGRFMTLFYLTIDADLNGIEWIRAGHDPAILYDPATDAYEELKGPGIALGIDEQFTYEPNRKTGLKNGQIIAIGTDGIWESYNKNDERFGRDRFKTLLKKYAHFSAAEILGVIFAELGEFSKGRKPEDDITLVIVKIQKEEGA